MVPLSGDTLFVIPDRSTAALTAKEGANAENAGAFFGPAADGRPKAVPPPSETLCQSLEKRHELTSLSGAIMLSSAVAQYR